MAGKKMKPSDLYINSRKFFGYLIPGSIWLGGLILATGQDLFTFLAIGNPWIKTTGFLIVSYAIGYILQKYFFGKYNDNESAPDDKNLLVSSVNDELDVLFQKISINDKEGKYKSLVDNNTIWYKTSAPELCKWYVLEHSGQLKTIIMDKEVGINFLVAIPRAMLVLSIGIILYGSWNIYGNINDILKISNLKIIFYIFIGLIGAASSLLLIIDKWDKKEVIKKRKEERDQWCKMFLLLKNNKQ
jgi:hypothetical protein